MQNKNYLTAVATIFAIIAVLQALRLLLGWQAEIGGWSVPSWLSFVAVLVAGYLAFMGFKLMKK